MSEEFQILLFGIKILRKLLCNASELFDFSDLNNTMQIKDKDKMAILEYDDIHCWVIFQIQVNSKFFKTFPKVFVHLSSKIHRNSVYHLAYIKNKTFLDRQFILKILTIM